MTVLVPTQNAVTDAFSILKVLADPGAAQAMLHDIQTAADTHAQSLEQVMQRLKEAEAREAAVTARESAVHAAEVALQEAQFKHAVREQDQMNQESALTLREQNLGAQERSHANTVSDFQDRVAQHDAEHAVRLSSLEEKRAFYKQEAEAQAAALDARKEELDQREAALTAGQQALDARHNQLKALLT